MDILLGIIVSSHLGFVGEYNEIHPHIRSEFDNGVVAGLYYNSEENVSAYIGGIYKDKNGFFIEGGLVSGYDIAEMPLIPYVRVGKEIGDNFNVFIAPGVETVNGETNVGVVIGAEIMFSLR
jgi:hypothetical protein